MPVANCDLQLHTNAHARLLHFAVSQTQPRCTRHVRRANLLNPLKYYFEVREISIRSGGLNFEISLLTAHILMHICGLYYRP